MVSRWRPDGTILYCNEAFARQCGRHLDEVIGANLFDLTPPSEIEQIHSNIARLSAASPSTGYDHHIPGEPDQERWQEWIDRAFFDEAGRVTGYLSVGRDITERKLAARRLAESERRLKLALEAGRQGVWELDFQSGRIRVDQALEELLRLPSGGYELDLERSAETYHPDDQEIVRRAIDGRASVATPTPIGSRPGVGPATAIGSGCSISAASPSVTRQGSRCGWSAPRSISTSASRRNCTCAKASSGSAWHWRPGPRRLGVRSRGRSRPLRRHLPSPAGLGPRNHANPLARLFELIHPRDRAKVRGCLRFAAAVNGRKAGSSTGCGGVTALCLDRGACPGIRARRATDRRLRLVGVSADITARKEAEIQLAHLALHDPLTGLPNRRALAEAIERAIARAQRSARPLAILALDLDGFKAINDRHGHPGRRCRPDRDRRPAAPGHPPQRPRGPAGRRRVRGDRRRPQRPGPGASPGAAARRRDAPADHACGPWPRSTSASASPSIPTTAQPPSSCWPAPTWRSMPPSARGPAAGSVPTCEVEAA